jgi:hypothetical protein
MRSDEMKAIKGLRDRGYAVIVWSPVELAGVNPVKVEDRSIELGYEVIEDLSTVEELPTPIEKWQQQRDAGIPFPDIDGR